MYICECGYEFEEPERLKEYRDRYFFETICVCPRCRLEGYEEASEGEE